MEWELTAYLSVHSPVPDGAPTVHSPAPGGAPIGTKGAYEPMWEKMSFPQFGHNASPFLTHDTHQVRCMCQVVRAHKIAPPAPHTANSSSHDLLPTQYSAWHLHVATRQRPTTCFVKSGF